MSDRNALLTVNEAADYLRVSRRQVYNLVKDGSLRRVLVGERIRFRPEDIEEYLAKGVER